MLTISAHNLINGTNKMNCLKAMALSSGLLTDTWGTEGIGNQGTYI